jgi:hypothetical protein
MAKLKKQWSIYIAVALALLSGSTYAATSSGKFNILGVGGPVDRDFVVVFAQNTSGGWNIQDCAASDEWWPAGTTHTFWLPKDQKELYAAILDAKIEKKPMFLTGSYAIQSYGNGAKCRLEELAQ